MLVSDRAKGKYNSFCRNQTNYATKGTSIFNMKHFHKIFIKIIIGRYNSLFSLSPAHTGKMFLISVIVSFCCGYREFGCVFFFVCVCGRGGACVSACLRLLSVFYL